MVQNCCDSMIGEGEGGGFHSVQDIPYLLLCRLAADQKVWQAIAAFPHVVIEKANLTIEEDKGLFGSWIRVSLPMTRDQKCQSLILFCQGCKFPLTI